MGQAREELAGLIPVLNQNQKAREIIKVLPRIIAFKLKGEGKPFFVISDNGALRLEDKQDMVPDIVIEGDSGEMVKIITRKREITHPIAEGKVWISKGKLSQMILFDRVLNCRPRPEK